MQHSAAWSAHVSRIAGPAGAPARKGERAACCLCTPLIFSLALQVSRMPPPVPEHRSHGDTRREFAQRSGRQGESRLVASVFCCSRNLCCAKVPNAKPGTDDISVSVVGLAGWPEDAEGVWLSRRPVAPLIFSRLVLAQTSRMLRRLRKRRPHRPVSTARRRRPLGAPTLPAASRAARSRAASPQAVRPAGVAAARVPAVLAAVDAAVDAAAVAAAVDAAAVAAPAHAAADAAADAAAAAAGWYSAGAAPGHAAPPGLAAHRGRRAAIPPPVARAPAAAAAARLLDVAASAFAAAHAAAAAVACTRSRRAAARAAARPRAAAPPAARLLVVHSRR